MVQRLSLALLIAALSALGLSLVQGNSLRYTVPKDWGETSQDGVKILSPKGLGDDKVFAVLLTPVADLDQGTGRKQLARLLKEIHEGAKVIESSEVQSKTTEGVEIVSQTVVLDAPDIGKHARLYFLIAEGKRYTLAFVMTNEDALIDKYGEAAMDLIGSVKLSGGPKAESGKPTDNVSAASKIPTGHTPDLFAGMPGWLPSGKGLKIPEPSLTGGKPMGLWYKVTHDTTGRARATLHVYLDGGIRASHPRLGGPRLYDHEGQKAQRGKTGVGTFSIAGGQIVERHDGYEQKAAFRTGKDSDGSFFEIGGARFRPLLPLTTQTLVGHWRGFGEEYKFFADGTFQYGTSTGTGEWRAAAGGSGTYTLDGYLLHVKPQQGAAWIDVAGRAGPMLVKGSSMLVRVR